MSEPWLSDEQFRRLQPLLPDKVRGVARVDDRRVISGIIHMLYRGRNAILRMFCRLKDWRRIATRYDKLATNFMAVIYLAAAVTWWW